MENMISWSLFFIVTINGKNNFCFNTVKTLTYLTCEVCWLQCLFLQEFGVKSNTNSLPPRWRNLERKWRCRVSRQVIQWQASILAGYDRGQEMLWSGLGGWTQAATLLPSAAPSKAVSSWLKMCPRALSTSRSRAWQQKTQLFTSVLETQWLKTAEQLNKNIHTQQTATWGHLGFLTNCKSTLIFIPFIVFKSHGWICIIFMMSNHSQLYKVFFNCKSMNKFCITDAINYKWYDHQFPSGSLVGISIFTFVILWSYSYQYYVVIIAFNYITLHYKLHSKQDRNI